MSRRLSPLLLIAFVGCSVEDPSGAGPGPQTIPSPVVPKDFVESAKSGGGIPSSNAQAIPAPAKPKESAEELITGGKRAREAGDFTVAEKFFERALEADPKNRTALFSLAKVVQELAGQFQRPHNSRYYLKSAGVIRKLRELYPDLSPDEKAIVGPILYNEACTLVQNGEIPKAIKVLGEAWDAGYDDLAHLDLDPELNSIRKDPEFLKLLARIERENVGRVMASTKPFDFDFTLNDLDGKPVSLAALKGKVVIVDFWGTWCPPCRKEMPHLIALHRKYHDKGLEIIGLNYENETSERTLQAVRKIVQEVPIPYKCLLGDEATQKKLPRFEGFPTTVFVDRGGKVKFQSTGYQPFGALEAIVETLLAEKVETPKPADTQTPAPKGDADKKADNKLGAGDKDRAAEKVGDAPK